MFFFGGMAKPFWREKMIDHALFRPYFFQGMEWSWTIGLGRNGRSNSTCCTMVLAGSWDCSGEVWLKHLPWSSQLLWGWIKVWTCPGNTCFEWFSVRVSRYVMYSVDWIPVDSVQPLTCLGGGTLANTFQWGGLGCWPFWRPHVWRTPEQLHISI